MASLNDDNGVIRTKNNKVADFDPDKLSKSILSQANAVSEQDSKYTLAAALTATKQMVNGAFASFQSHKDSRTASANSIPLPLPIESDLISTEHTLARVLEGIMIQNQLAEDLDHLKDVARESTLTRVVNALSELSTTILKALTGNDTFGEFRSDFALQTKTLSAKFGDLIKTYVPFAGIISDKFDENISPLLAYAKMQTAYAKEQLEAFKKWFVYQRNLAIRNESQDDPNQLTGFKAFAANTLMSIPGADTLAKAIEVIGKTAAFYGALGGALGATILPILTRLGIGAGAMAGSALASIFTPIVAFLGGMATFIGGLAFLATSAVLYSLWKNPEQIGQYMEAIGKIWTQNIAPTFKWLYEEIFSPIGAALYAWWNGPGETALLGIGDFINQTLIYILGTALPAVLTTIGNIIKSGYEFVKSNMQIWYDLFTGEIGIVTAFTRMFTGIATFIGSLFDNIATGIIRMLGLSSFFDMDSDESFVGRMTRFFVEDLPNMIIKELNSVFTSLSVFWDDMKTGIVGFIEQYNPIDMIKERITSMIDAILGIFPSIDDIKKFMIDAIPTWAPDKLRNWMIDAIGKPQETPLVESPASAGYNSEMSDIYKDFVAKPISGAAQTVIINAPNTTNNQNSSTNVSNGGRSGSGGIASTRPEVSEWDKKLYFIPQSF